MSQSLFEYPNTKVVTSGQKRILEDTMAYYKGVLPLAHRFAGRSFCTPGERLRLRKKDLYPARLGGVGLDELWICCTTPIVTGTVDSETGGTPFREGEAHVITPNQELVSLQELIETNPKAVIGEAHEKFSRENFGKPTWGIVSKYFDNKNPIPHHLHWAKWEVYDIHRYFNPSVHYSHYHTTAMGLYPWVTKDMLLECFMRFGSPGGNEIRRLSPHVKVPVDQGGFCMPNGVLHSPTDVATHEVHVLMDEHFLAEDLTLDGEIPAEVAFLACREQDYPKARHGDWEYLVSIFDSEANQDPDFVLKNSRAPLRADEFCSDGVEATWIVHGNFLGEQKCSILRLILQPNAKTILKFDSACVFHTNGGQGYVCDLKIRFEKSLAIGKLASEMGFITQIAAQDGVAIGNSGSEPLVLTLDFPQNAHRITPGT